MRLGNLWKFSIVATVVVLAGCASTGNQEAVDLGSLSKIERNASTKLDVYDFLGQPARVEYVENDGGSTWEYLNSEGYIHPMTFVPFFGLLAGGEKWETTVTTLYFDAKDVCTDLRTESFEKYISQWVSSTMPAADASMDKNNEAVRMEMDKYRLTFDQREADKIKRHFRHL